MTWLPGCARQSETWENLVPRRNRVDPWGDLFAVEARGMFTGNRGCLVDENGEVVRHHQGSLWIVCATEFKDWRSPLAAPNRWTPLFFLDDAVALAAGHRPCGLCRRDSYDAYREAIASAAGRTRPLRPKGTNVPKAPELNRRLALERLRRGQGVARAHDRRLWTANIDDLPIGAVISGPNRVAHLVMEDHLKKFSFDGWGPPVQRQRGMEVQVITPPTSVAALIHGYQPVLHPTAGDCGVPGQPFGR